MISKIEKIMNAYIFILVCMLYVLGRLLDYALGLSWTETIFSFKNLIQILALATYLLCLLKLKRDGVIDSIW